jgi:hypothetical protein
LKISDPTNPNKTIFGPWYSTLYIDVMEYMVIIFLIRNLCARPTFHMLRGYLYLNTYVLIIYLIVTATTIISKYSGIENNDADEVYENMQSSETKDLD